MSRAHGAHSAWSLSQFGDISYLDSVQQQIGETREGQKQPWKRLGIVLFCNGDDAMARTAPLTFDTATFKTIAPAKGPARPGVLRRFYDAVIHARTLQAEAEVARYLETHCKLTDQVEREIERRVGRYPATGGLFGEGGSACR